MEQPPWKCFICGSEDHMIAKCPKPTKDNKKRRKQLTNWILYSGATCHMTPEVSGFISGSLEDKDKYIEVADGHHVTEKKVKYKYKCATIMESLSSQHYTKYF